MMEPIDRFELVSEQAWESYRKSRFVRKIFHPYDSLLYWAGSDEEWESSTPYRGQPYDPNCGEIIEGGWDHEHCDVCWARIEEGDSYWSDEITSNIELCEACYPIVMRRLQG
ncbi:hypothetical protein [Singulisphaera sp. PoT]|uniref:hypothetical protein n=1 Tax=Singulisphaera sp. PoT TaxID=3411797 RepID=UPI003BF4728E